MKSIINVIVKEPNKAPYEQKIDNETLDDQYRILGGYSTILTDFVSDGLFCIVNEEGDYMNIPHNFLWCNGVGYVSIKGSAIFCRFSNDVDGMEFDDVQIGDLERVIHYMKNNALM